MAKQKDEENTLDELAKIGQEIQPEEYAVVASSSSAAAAVETPKPKPQKKKKKSKSLLEKKKKESKSLLGKHEAPDAKWVRSQKRIDSTTHLGVAEFFYLLEQTEAPGDKILLLRCAKSDPVIMTLLNMNYNPSVYGIFVPDESVESYRNNTLPWGINPYTLRTQYRRLKYLFANSPEGKKAAPGTKSKIFAEFMESLHPAEAKIFYGCATQTLDAGGITDQLVKDAFGDSRFPNI